MCYIFGISMRKRGGIRVSYRLSLKSQVAVELVIVLAFILIILIALMAVNQDLLNSVSGQFRAAKAKVVLNELSDAAQHVYQQGVGAQTRVFVSIPHGVVSTQVSGQTLTISMSGAEVTRDVYKNLNFQVSGAIPMDEGNYWLTVKSRQGYVVIGFSLMDVAPGGFSTTMIPGNISFDEISLRNIVDEDIDVVLSYYGDANINVLLGQNSLSLAPDEIQNVSVTITSQASAPAGVYTGTIQISANTTQETQNSELLAIVNVVTQLYCISCPMVLLFPAQWNFGIMGVDRLYSNVFYVCSNLVGTQSVGLSFSNSTYTGFDPGIASKTTTVNVASQDCNSTTVYVNTTNALSEPHTTILQASADSYSDFSIISFNIGEDSLPPEIYLMQPADNYSSLLGNIVFTYNTSDFASDIDHCDLIMNDSIVDTDSTIMEDAEQSFTVLGLSNGYYSWTVNCTDAAAGANEGTASNRNLLVNFTTVYATPELAFEEDYVPQWTTEVQILDDGSFATAYDEGPPSHANYPPPDFVEFDFPNLGISSGYGIESVILTIRHYERLQSGWFDADDRHQIECFNGVAWIAVEPYNWTPETDETWIYYISPDLSGCISSASVANDIHIRITYDPADDTGAIQYIDWVQVEVNISTALYPDLWELIVDDPQPLDFSSGLNTTNNTFGRAAGDDGWDWKEDVYGGGESGAMFNVDPDMDGNTSDSTIAANNRLEIRIGDGAPGAPKNSDDDTYNGPASSAAYGVEFNITSEQYSAIIAGGTAQLSFDWYVDEDAGWGNGLDAGDEAWIKARFITPSTTYWLGSALDTGDNDADAFNEVWFMDNPEDALGHESFDVSSYITSEGTYYFDLGIAVGDWDNNEGFGGYFDNIMLIIIK